MQGAPRAAGGGAEPKPGRQEFESRHLRTRVREELESRRARECVRALGAPGAAAASAAKEGREGEPGGGLEARPRVGDVLGTSERGRPLPPAGLSRSETGRGPGLGVEGLHCWGEPRGLCWARLPAHRQRRALRSTPLRSGWRGR